MSAVHALDLSVVRNSEVVRCSGAVNASTGIAVGTATVARYTVDVRYWEWPLYTVYLLSVV